MLVSLYEALEDVCKLLLSVGEDVPNLRWLGPLEAGLPPVVSFWSKL